MKKRKSVAPNLYAKGKSLVLVVLLGGLVIATTWTVLSLDRRPLPAPTLLLAPSVTVTSPNGGEVWAAGSRQTISWCVNRPEQFTEDLRIELLADGGVHSTIAGGVPLGSHGRGSCDWKIPLFHPSGSNFRIRITAFRRLSDYPWYAEVIDESNAPFTITDSGKIAFVRSIYEPASNTDIYVIDTSGQRRLTTNPRQDVDPAWSADWSMIAFTSYRDGNPEIYVMRADGTNKRRLTNDPAADAHPTWSPDGTRLAFCSERDGNREIYTMNIHGAALENLTHDSRSDWDPVWSPDGAMIAFVSGRDANYEIYVMNADGTYPRRLTTNPAFDIEPAWSPDGAKIAFVSGRDGNYEIYVMNADGTYPRRLTTNPAFDIEPAWSPDGAKIAFYTYRDGNAEIYVMNSDASYKTNLTNSSVTPDWDPSWTPARPYRIRHPLTPVPLLAPPRP